jgi:hypothetical protein
MRKAPLGLYVAIFSRLLLMLHIQIFNKNAKFKSTTKDVNKQEHEQLNRWDSELELCSEHEYLRVSSSYARR